MSTILERLQTDMVAAMKAKDTKKAKEILSADAAQPPATLANNQ